jgi:type II secretory pathway component GspD/PulD (secretin)
LPRAASILTDTPKVKRVLFLALSNSLPRVAAAVLAISFTAAVFTVPASGSGGSARGPITLDAHDQPVRDVLLRVGELAHLNVSIGEDVRGNVNLILREATADDAFRAICSQLRLRCTREGRTMSVRGSSAAIVSLAIVPAQRAASVLRTLYPRLTVRVDPSANTLAIEGSDADLQAARAVIQGLDVRDVSKPTSEALTLHGQNASVVADRLHRLFPAAKITVVSRSALLVSAVPADLAQIKSLVAALDAPTPAPTTAPVSSDAVKVTQRRPDDVARAVARQMPRVRTAVAGSAVAISGSPEDIARAKTLIAALDLPAFDARYVQIYRLKNVDATSVGELVRHAFPSLAIAVDASLNALTVTATGAEHQRIAEGIAQLDGTAGSANGASALTGGGYGGPSGHEIVALRSILPAGQGQTGSAAPQDIAQTVQQALQTTNPDLHVIVSTGTQQLVLTGSPQSIRAAKQMIAELDVVPPSVVLDTEILELDQSSSRNLGLQLGTTSIGTTFSEVQPTPDPNGGTGRLMRLQALTRTGISFQAQLNLLVQNGKARVLADPRITTVSGRTATIRAGDTISILTTVGGGTGTVATTQLQSFQTGVTLDITPIITADGELSVSLHPVVNSLSGFLNNVPQISTRDTQTTVHLRDEETLVIGGLIQESTQQTESKVPLVGDIPLIGRVFRNQQTTNTRNELIIVVTPHLLLKGTTTTIPGAANPSGMAVPTPRPLPTVPPGTTFPPPGVPPQPSVRRTPVPAQRGVTAPRAPSAAITIGATALPSASPTAMPSAFAQANVFVYGSPPPSTFAAPGDAPQIFYAMLSPTVLGSNTVVHVNAITTTNVQRLTIGAGTTTISLSPAGISGTWQGVFSANTLAVPATVTSMQLTLTASRSDGASASAQIPVSIQR